jgi:hypothetical protein
LTTEAYEALFNEERKREYDESLRSRGVPTLSGGWKITIEAASPSILPAEQKELLKGAILLHSLRFFESYNWDIAAQEFKRFAQSMITQGSMTAEDFLEDATLKITLKSVASMIWRTCDAKKAPGDYGKYLKELRGSGAVDIAAINQDLAIKDLVYSKAISLWREHDFESAPQHYKSFLKSCLESGIIENYRELGKQCRCVAVERSKQIWNECSFEEAPTKFAYFVEQCDTLRIAKSERLNKTCRPLAIKRVLEMIQSGSHNDVRELYLKFIERSEVSGVLNHDLAKQDERLGPILKDILS